MSEQEKQTVLDALEYVRSALEVLPATSISHCEIKIAAYRNTNTVINALTDAWKDEKAEKPQEV